MKSKDANTVESTERESVNRALRNLVDACNIRDGALCASGTPDEYLAAAVQRYNRALQAAMTILWPGRT